MLRPRLADKGAHVDEARRDDIAGAIDDMRMRRQRRSDDLRPEIANDPVDDEHAAALFGFARRVDQPRIDERQRLVGDGAGRGVFHRASLIGQMLGQRREHGHAHRNAHFDLFADQALRPVGDV